MYMCDHSDHSDHDIVNDMSLSLLLLLPDYEGVSEVWQLVPSDMFSLISIPFQGKAVEVGVSYVVLLLIM